MKIKLEWDAYFDEWDVHDDRGDRLYSSSYNGEYISVDEVEELRNFKEAFAAYVRESVPSFAVLMYEDLCKRANIDPYEGETNEQVET